MNTLDRYIFTTYPNCRKIIGTPSGDRAYRAFRATMRKELQKRDYDTRAYGMGRGEYASTLLHLKHCRTSRANFMGLLGDLRTMRANYAMLLP
jgi:hypothetical protein